MRPEVRSVLQRGIAAGMLATSVGLAACTAPPATAPIGRGSATPSQASPSAATTVAPQIGTPLSPGASRSPDLQTPQASPGTTQVGTPGPTMPPTAPVQPPVPAARFVVAGLPWGGEGASIGRVEFPEILDVEVARSGARYVLTPDALWRYAPGGTLERLAGGSRQRSPSLAGQPARDVGFGVDSLRLTLDAEDRPLLTHRTTASGDFDALYRLGSDGRLATLWSPRPLTALVAIVPGEGGRLWLLIREQAGFRTNFSWWSLTGSEAAKRIREVSDEGDARVDEAALASGGTADGKLFYATPEGLKQVDPATGMITPGTTAGRPVDHVDTHGVAFAVPKYPEEAATLTVFMPGESPRTRTIGRLPLWVYGAAQAPDGATLLHGGGDQSGAGYFILNVASDGTSRRETGAQRTQLGLPTEIQLSPAAIVAIAPDALVLFDEQRRQVLRVRPGQPVEALTAPWPGEEPTDGMSPLAGAPLVERLGVDAEGRIYVLHRSFMILRFKPGGSYEVVYTAPDPQTIQHMAVAPDGTVYVVFHVRDGEPEPVRRIEGPRATKALPATTNGAGAIAVDAQGSVCMILPVGSEGPACRLARWTEAAGLTEVGTVALGTNGIHNRYNSGDGSNLAIDPAGRWWLGDGPRAQGDDYPALSRFDPATRTQTVLVGDGSPNLGGDSVEGSLSALRGFAFDLAGDLYVCDQQAVRRVSGIGK